MKTLLLQLSDLHIREPGRLAYGRLETAPYLRNAVDSILRLPQRPDAVVLTGDLTDFGRPDEYKHLSKLLAPLNLPTFLLPGNHDDRDQMRQSFADHGYLGTHGFIQYSVPIGGLQLIALDTVNHGEAHGGLCSERLQWLADALEIHKDRPVVIAMHHPPFRTHIGHMDQIGLLKGSDQLESIVSRYTNVERIICGHIHRGIQVRFGGTVAMTAPSPAHQVCLNLAPDAASEWILEPPGFVLHALSESNILTSHTAVIGQFDGPHPFHVDGKLID